MCIEFTFFILSRLFTSGYMSRPMYVYRILMTYLPYIELSTYLYIYILLNLSNIYKFNNSLKLKCSLNGLKYSNIFLGL